MLLDVLTNFSRKGSPWPLHFSTGPLEQSGQSSQRTRETSTSVQSAIVQEVGSIKRTQTAFLAEFKFLVKHEQHFSASISRAVFGK